MTISSSLRRALKTEVRQRISGLRALMGGNQPTRALRSAATA